MKEKQEAIFVNYWYHFKRAFLPIALLLVTLALYQMIYRLNNIWYSLGGLLLEDRWQKQYLQVVVSGAWSSHSINMMG